MSFGPCCVESLNLDPELENSLGHFGRNQPRAASSFMFAVPPKADAGSRDDDLTRSVTIARTSSALARTPGARVRLFPRNSAT